MKNVMGGNIPVDELDSGNKCYKCCPNGDANSSMCSDKVTVKEGETASCTLGTLTSVSC